MSKKVKQRILQSDVGDENYRIVDLKSKEMHISKSRIGREAIEMLIEHYKWKDSEHAS